MLCCHFFRRRLEQLGVALLVVDGLWHDFVGRQVKQLEVTFRRATYVDFKLCGRRVVCSVWRVSRRGGCRFPIVWSVLVWPAALVYMG